MNILLLSCSTGEGHNHCALAVKEALEARGHHADFLDMLRMFSEPGPLSFDRILNRISTRMPDVFGMMYHAGEMFSATGVTSPVYLASIRHARHLGRLICDKRYDAVVCSHLFPMETLSYLRKRNECATPCFGILSDYACIPFLPETDLDAYFLPHIDVMNNCLRAGMPEDRLKVTGMPVYSRFQLSLSREEARAELGLCTQKHIYLVMTGGIGCGDATALCDSLMRIPDENMLICAMPGRNEDLRCALEEKYVRERVNVIPFTDKVSLYMRAADVLLTKAGGISSSEAAVVGVPLVHTMAIPGIETLNASFFMEHGMSLFANSIDEAARFADRLILDPVVRARQLEAQRANLPKDGAMSIARCIEDYVRTYQRPSPLLPPNEPKPS